MYPHPFHHQHYHWSRGLPKVTATNLHVAPARARDNYPEASVDNPAYVVPASSLKHCVANEGDHSCPFPQDDCESVALHHLCRAHFLGVTVSKMMLILVLLAEKSAW